MMLEDTVKVGIITSAVYITVRVNFCSCPAVDIVEEMTIARVLIRCNSHLLNVPDGITITLYIPTRLFMAQ